MTTAEMEPLAWAWPRPAEKPSIWALTFARLLAQTPGIRKVPWASVMATVPDQSLRETLAPGSGRPDGVTTEPRRTWLGHLQVLELHPGQVGRTHFCASRGRPGHASPVGLGQRRRRKRRPGPQLPEQGPHGPHAPHVASAVRAEAWGEGEAAAHRRDFASWEIWCNSLGLEDAPR